MHENRPWGSFDVLLDTETYKVKRLTVNQNSMLSLQMHNFRDEHWVVVHGTGKIIIGKKSFDVKPGESFIIPRHEKHRLMNNNKFNKLVVIETQTGDYFGEDDIIRLEDNYGRK